MSKVSHAGPEARPSRRLGRRFAVAAIAAGACSLGLAGSAQAAFGISSFSTSLSGAYGVPSTQAGGHDDLKTSFRLATMTSPSNQTLTDGQLRDIEFELPAGFYGNPQAAPACSPAEFGNIVGGSCPVVSQVGIARVVRTPTGFVEQVPVYNIATAPGQTAILGFQIMNINVEIDVRTNPANNHTLIARARNVNSGIQVYGVDLTLWGVPADPSNDGLRYPMGWPGGPQHTSSGAAMRPFLSSPARCDGPLVTTARARSWQEPDRWVTAQTTMPARTGCDQLKFESSLSVVPSSRRAGAPSGYTVDVTVPQEESVAGLATPQLADAKVTLPQGVAISPSSADGLEACSDAQLAQTSQDPDRCPSGAKIGTVSIDTPILGNPLEGAVYFGTQESNDPMSGDMYRIFLVAEGSGVRMKLKGAVQADPQTGQLTTTFANNPQLPFNRLRLQFMGGNRAPLVNPTTCGAKTATGSLRATNDIERSVSSTFSIDEGCPTGQFAPTFTAGTVNPLAGAFSPFTMTVTRQDADQELSQIGLDLPPGLLGALGSVPLCAEAQLAAGTCGPEFQIGTTTVAAGPGSNPYSLPGKVFLGGPYKGAPFSLSIVVPAKAGPIDLGLVVVRSPLVVDAAQAKVSAPADPLPRILGGVPLKLRSINVTLDRPNFMFNATSCEPTAVGGALTSVGGGVANVGARYQAQGCAGLALAPRLDLSFAGGANEMRVTKKRRGHPGINARMTWPRGDANLKQVKVDLPLAVALDPKNAKALCTPEQAAARSCPEASIVGRASASTPALHEPLSGPVYFAEGRRTTASGASVATLPRLWLKLEGEGVPLDLWANSDVTKNQLTTTFVNVPDAPINEFSLEIFGGQNGILAATTNVCTAERVADTRYSGQNGKVTTAQLRIGVPNCRPQIASVSSNQQRVVVRVAGIGAGKLTGRAPGMQRTSRNIRSADAANLTLRLTAASRRQLARGKTVRQRVQVRFAPKSGRATTLRRSVTIKPAGRR